jgi:hypothetical protein
MFQSPNRFGIRDQTFETPWYKNGQTPSVLARHTAGVYDQLVLQPGAEIQTRPLNRTKLMLCGQGRAGKTSTRNALMGELFDASQASTRAGSVSEACCTLQLAESKGWTTHVPPANLEEEEQARHIAAHALKRDTGSNTNGSSGGSGGGGNASMAMVNGMHTATEDSACWNVLCSAAPPEAGEVTSTSHRGHSSAKNHVKLPTADAILANESSGQ